ncbi:DNA repair protein RecN [Mucispirillum schaedleri]|uniref:DNA repair protein RecN n=1 Tax=Mucispirillum schaedleri ASF457 TaxID=1379858 RepID=V2PWW8_9BACT|nr:DNA repair protein RecN [Mucispirillum schaedleri]MCX4360696.1 DNA repair protein RecN [Mucispirillum schaedleri]USF23070.1 DNA repair protein RecN [Mucispirillum schaedleri ASF457]SIW08002.1 DNA repair protein RecN [Mucispirillum schaedleri ASF457]
MLTYLAVKNIAVIEKVSLEFEKGLNIITGETGAGKSVLVGALKYLTGDRLGRVTPRNQQEKFSAESIFCDDLNIAPELIEQYEIEDELIISRETDENGKNKAFINGKAAPVNRLKDISESLIDIHGQHENQFLFNPAKHLSFVDFFVDNNLKDDFSSKYRAYKDKLDKLEDLKKNRENIIKMQEMYKMQYNEILSYNIDLEKDAVIEEKIKFLSSIEKVREAVTSSIDALSDGEITASELIEKSIRTINSISNMSQDAQKAEEFLQAALTSINEASSLITSLLSEEEQETTPEELNSLIDRKYKLQDLSKRYGGSLENVIEYKNKLEEDLAEINGEEDITSKLERDVMLLKEEALKSSKILNDARKKAAAELSKKTENILHELELNSAKFEVVFKENGDLDYSGGISAEFFILTNAGFKPAPLATVASGGEVSRVMLALKEVFADFDNVGTMLFDEIDTGISGKAAQSVAKKLKQLSKKKQIIVITHLPVVAAMGDSHFHISKSEKDGISSTNILKLDKAAKINIIATMISGEATPTAMQQAEDMINRGSI